MSIVEIHFTIDDREVADHIVSQLLNQRLVACGQRIGPIVSRYWWQGKQEETEEWLVLLKTTDVLAERVVGAVKELHTYDTPDVLIHPASGGNSGYLSWVDSETKDHV